MDVEMRHGIMLNSRDDDNDAFHRKRSLLERFVLSMLILIICRDCHFGAPFHHQTLSEHPIGVGHSSPNVFYSRRRVHLQLPLSFA